MKQEKSRLIDEFKKRGLKMTRQRAAIIEVMRGSRDSHMSFDEILAAAKKVDPKISAATVYRNVLFLESAGMITRIKLADKKSYFEKCGFPENEKGHHDHFICDICGGITEFLNPGIESLQEKAAASIGFSIRCHKMEIYGICSRCMAQKDGG